MINGKMEIIEPPTLKNPAPGSATKELRLDPGEKICHRMYIPSTIVTPGPPNPLNPRQPTMNVSQNIGYMKCVKEKCMLWSVHDDVCLDVVAARAQKILAEYAEAKLNDVLIPGGGSAG